MATIGSAVITLKNAAWRSALPFPDGDNNRGGIRVTMTDGSIAEMDQAFILRAVGLIVADAKHRGTRIDSFVGTLEKLAGEIIR